MTFADIRWDLFLCGLGLFLFGVVLMGDGLKSFAGDKLREYIDKYTSRPWQGVIIGALMTALVQSSSATTAITIGFVRAGLMTLEQATGIIIGANIGSTMTAFLIGLNVEGLSVYFIFAGALILMFTKKKKMEDIAHILVGFGVLFYGIGLIGDVLIYLKDVKQFTDIANACADNPFIGLAIGIVMTCAMQSSAAAIGVIQVIYETGAITFKAILPFLFGSNIGTCITAIMACMGGNISSKRTALLHLLFNVFGTVLGMGTLSIINTMIMSLSTAYSIQPMMQIAIVHIIFNIVTAIIVFPFIKQMCALVRMIIKGEEPKKREVDLSNLNASAFPVASAALLVAHDSLEEMKELAAEITIEAKDYILSNGKIDLYDQVMQTEDLIDQYDNSISNFLFEVSIDQMSDESAKINTLYLNVNRDLERVGDLAVNVAEFAKAIFDSNGVLCDEAIAELNHMFEILEKMVHKSFEYIDNEDNAIFDELQELESTLDKLEYDSRQNHFRRLSEGMPSTPILAAVYADVLSNIERMGDHCCNIANDVKRRVQ